MNDNIVGQRADVPEGVFAAEDLEFRDGFAVSKYTDQSSQPEDVVEMTVREQDAGEVFETSLGSFDLAQSSFSAIDDEAGLIVFYDEGGKSPLCGGRCGGGS